MQKSSINLISNFKVEQYNLAFYTPESLVEFTRANNPEAARIACVAELFARWFLSRDFKLAEMIDSLLSDGERSNLGLLLDEDFLHNPTEETLQRQFWNTDNPFSQKCMVAVRKKLIELCCETDGFIPVYLRDWAFFIPFHFTEGLSEIRDQQGIPISGWQESYKTVIKSDNPYTCVVHCNQQGLPTLTGKSLMLPLQLAYWRKQGFIKYNHLRLLATGAIENNRLQAVATAQKTAAVNVCFPQSYLLFPESTRYYANKPWEICLAVEMTVDNLLLKLPEIIESKGLYLPTLSDTLKRLPELNSTRDEIYNHWENFYNRVDLYSKSLNSLLNPEEYMLCLMLKSSSLCHLGKTDEALHLNRKAQKFAQKNNLEKLLRRMEIEELVELQDKELFAEILNLSRSLQENIERINNPDLLMRYFGTMGQAHCCGSLAGFSGFSRDYALSCFEKAILFAQKTNSPGDIAQDINYRYLWYALFEPETEEAEECFSEAKNYIDFNLQENRNIQTKNKNFLYRYKAFAIYRHLLATNTPPAENFEKYLLPDDALSWLQGTVCKYIGAACASCGCRQKAEKLFKKSFSQLSHKNSIIQFIQMTAWAEAYRSLGEIQYRDQALRQAKDLQDLYPSAEQWIKFLENKGEFPGLKYWY